MSSLAASFTGVGLGIRRGLLQPITEYLDQLGEAAPAFDFFEVAPENWIGWGGQHSDTFQRLVQSYPFVSHGLSLSIGGPDPLQYNFLKDLKHFLNANQMLVYSEHLSFCTDDAGHLYDLMPIPLTQTMVDYVAQRIRRVQEYLDRRIAIENVSYYASTALELSELEFFLAVVEQADCDILLDVNNVYVNSVNHGYEPVSFIQALPSDKIVYMHIAGHYVESEKPGQELIIDTHGAAVVPLVWQLLEVAYQAHGVRPTLLERDFNYPAFKVLIDELQQIRHLQSVYSQGAACASNA